MIVVLKMFKFELDLDVFSWWCIFFLSVVVLAYVLLDVNYFLRVIFTVGTSKLFQNKLKINEVGTVYGMCLTADLDLVFKHMNNARFVRELDFARFHFYERTGLYSAICSAHSDVLQSATNIRYRRPIPIFTLYKITTKLIYWDEKAVYLEQQFVTLSDGFVRSVALSKQSVVKFNVAEVVGRLFGKDSSYRMDTTPELKAWIDSMDLSSHRLRKKD